MFRVSAGKPALSSFRLEKLRAALENAAPHAIMVDTRYWYFVELAAGAKLDKRQAALLDRLLGIDAAVDEPAEAGLQPWISF